MHGGINCKSCNGKLGAHWLETMEGVKDLTVLVDQVDMAD